MFPPERMSEVAMAYTSRVAARSGGTGPMVVAEADCTIWIPFGWSARPGEAGALVLQRGAA